AAGAGAAGGGTGTVARMGIPGLVVTCDAMRGFLAGGTSGGGDPFTGGSAACGKACGKACGNACGNAWLTAGVSRAAWLTAGVGRSASTTVGVGVGRAGS